MNGDPRGHSSSAGASCAAMNVSVPQIRTASPRVQQESTHGGFHYQRRGSGQAGLAGWPDAVIWLGFSCVMRGGQGGLQDYWQPADAPGGLTDGGAGRWLTQGRPPEPGLSQRPGRSRSLACVLTRASPCSPFPPSRPRSVTCCGQRRSGRDLRVSGCARPALCRSKYVQYYA